MSLPPEKSIGAMFQSYKRVCKKAKYPVSSSDAALLLRGFALDNNLVAAVSNSTKNKD
jgi:hypothetical protein